MREENRKDLLLFFLYKKQILLTTVLKHIFLFFSFKIALIPIVFKVQYLEHRITSALNIYYYDEIILKDERLVSWDVISTLLSSDITDCSSSGSRLLSGSGGG